MKPWWRKIPWQRWGIDRKRGLVALGLIAVALLLWGRLILKNAPRTALADPKEGQVALQTSPTRQSAELTREIHLQLPTDRKRDLFAMAEHRFARTENTPESAPAAKSVGETSDSEVKRRAVQQAAATLRLQTTILGTPPRAMIDGQLLGPGETIKGFEIVEIEQRQVILQKDGIQVRLEM